MAIYKVTMILAVDEGHPRKWVADAISENLNDGEDILDIELEQVEDYKDSVDI